MTASDVVMVVCGCTFLWITEQERWDWGVTGGPVTGHDLRVWILVGCAALQVGRWFTRAR